MEECPMTFIKAYTTKLAGVFYAPSKVLLATAGILLLSLLFACHSVYGGQDGDTYSVGATVTGHTGEVSLTLIYGDDNKTETLKIPTGTENFTFGAKLVDNQSFTLSVTAPTGQTCRSSLTEGIIIDTDITDITVICVPTYSVSGVISGLANGETITLTLSPTGGVLETEDITGDVDETTDDVFAFDTRLVNGDTYTITTSSPAGKTCTVNNAGTRTMGDADVTDISVTCVVINTYSVGGGVSGLANGETITLTLTPTGGTAETKDVTGDADGTSDDTFAFDTAIAYDTIYGVTTSSPIGKACTVVPAGRRSMGAANVTDVAVTCIVAPYSVSGAVSGLANGETITLTLSHTGGTAETEDISGDADETAADTFAFDTAIAYDTIYGVTTSSPIGKACTVVPAGRRSMGAANVTDVAVTCIVAPYSVSGTVTGAANSQAIRVVLTYYDDNTRTGGTKKSGRVNANGTFSFTDIPENKFYTLQASSTIFGETCSDLFPTLTQITADVTGAMVTCTASTHTGPFLRVYLTSDNFETSLTTANVFIDDNAIPDTSDPTTSTRVIRGSDADIVIVPNIFILDADGYNYDIGINNGQYYAVTVTTTGPETCTFGNNGTGGPMTGSNVVVSITCQ